MPRTGILVALSEALHGGERPESGYPLVVKSRHSRRADLDARVDGPAELRVLATQRSDEPLLLQEFVANSGWDPKLWVIAGEVFAGVCSALMGATPDGIRSARWSVTCRRPGPDSPSMRLRRPEPTAPELEWFKSSHSTDDGGECVEVAWRKRSYSRAERCVEFAAAATHVHIRDSKQLTAPC
ncbi:DUF397 domain-containing protein [Streptomyces sp. NPDC056308]|uniref:DUF397 domain-containing protein n=1 Tax=unclassified Streptomyces TaxID=2593676 RepID=UPI0035E18B51